MGYVGIVLVSHSHKVVEGLRDIIRQVIHEVPVEIAGGTEGQEIGTSIEKIITAVKTADAGKGVLIFYDLGSAKMNAEIAIEMLDSIPVKVVDAPLVEGAYVAAVESNMRKSIDEVFESVRKEF